MSTKKNIWWINNRCSDGNTLPAPKAVMAEEAKHGDSGSGGDDVYVWGAFVSQFFNDDADELVEAALGDDEDISVAKQRLTACKQLRRMLDPVVMRAILDDKTGGNVIMSRLAQRREHQARLSAEVISGEEAGPPSVAGVPVARPVAAAASAASAGAAAGGPATAPSGAVVPLPGAAFAQVSRGPQPALEQKEDEEEGETTGGEDVSARTRRSRVAPVDYAAAETAVASRRRARRRTPSPSLDNEMGEGEEEEEAAAEDASMGESEGGIEGGGPGDQVFVPYIHLLYKLRNCSWFTEVFDAFMRQLVPQASPELEALLATAAAHCRRARSLEQANVVLNTFVAAINDLNAAASLGGRASSLSARSALPAQPGGDHGDHDDDNDDGDGEDGTSSGGTVTDDDGISTGDDDSDNDDADDADGRDDGGEGGDGRHLGGRRFSLSNRWASL